MKYVFLVYEFLKLIFIIVVLKLVDDKSELYLLLAMVPKSILILISIFLSILLKENRSIEVDSLIQVKNGHFELYFVKCQGKIYAVNNHDSISKINFEKLIGADCIYDVSSQVVRTGINYTLVILNYIYILALMLILTFIVKAEVKLLWIGLFFLYFCGYNIFNYKHRWYKYNVSKRGSQSYVRDGEVMEIYKEEYKYLVSSYPELTTMSNANMYYSLISINSLESRILFQSKYKECVEGIKSRIVRYVNSE